MPEMHVIEIPLTSTTTSHTVDGFPIEIERQICKLLTYRHGQPNPDSHSNMRVQIRLPMSVHISKIENFTL